MRFRLQVLRFLFDPREPIHFPPGRTGNIIRGALGESLYGAADNAYERLFSPVKSACGPSGLADPPRPFVLRAAHLGGQTFPPGNLFSFDVHLFDLGECLAASLAQAFAKFGRTGLGPERRRVELVRTDSPAPLEFNLAEAVEPVSQIRIAFVTPTELKAKGQPLLQPDFAVLASRARDRISTLRSYYGEGPLPIDFRQFGARASSIRMIRSDTAVVETKRRSRRTGAEHSIGGFTGRAEYEGDLSPFVPYLELAQWTGVGRHTVWGNGEIRIEEKRAGKKKAGKL